MGQLEDKIKSKDAKIGIIGMGYVGIPLGLEFSNKGFTVLGFDKDTKRVSDINTGKQIMKHIPKNPWKNSWKIRAQQLRNFLELRIWIA